MPYCCLVSNTYKPNPGSSVNYKGKKTKKLFLMVHCNF